MYTYIYIYLYTSTDFICFWGSSAWTNLSLEKSYDLAWILQRGFFSYEKRAPGKDKEHNGRRVGKAERRISAVNRRFKKRLEAKHAGTSWIKIGIDGACRESDLGFWLKAPLEYVAISYVEDRGREWMVTLAILRSAKAEYRETIGIFRSTSV